MTLQIQQRRLCAVAELFLHHGDNSGVLQSKCTYKAITSCALLAIQAQQHLWRQQQHQLINGTSDVLCAAEA